MIEIDFFCHRYRMNRPDFSQAGTICTTVQILNIRQLIEKAREFNHSVFLCFVNYNKMVDKVKWSLLWKILEKMGTPKHLIRMIRSLYQDNIVKIRIDQTYSNNFQVYAGVRQGCILSLPLFNIYSEYVMRQVLEECKEAYRLGERRLVIYNMRIIPS